jgi:hypothetical protein
VDLLEREAELKAILWRELDADRPRLPHGIGWEPEHRGFAERLRIGHGVYLPGHGELIEEASTRVPIGGLNLGRMSGANFGLLTGEYRGTLTSVEFQLGAGDAADSRCVNVLVSGQLPNLRRLVVESYAPNALFAPLATSTLLRHLRTVALPPLAPDHDPEPFTWAGSVEGLLLQEGLSMFRDGLPNVHTLGVARLLSSDANVLCGRNALPRLAALSTTLSEQPRSPQRLRRMGYTGEEIRPQPHGRVDAFGLLRRRDRPLAVLRLIAHPSGDEAERLFHLSWADHLRVVAFDGAVANVRAVFNSPRLGQLRQLHLKCTGTGVLSPKRIADAVCWRSLTTFDAAGCPFGEHGGFNLARRLQAPNLKHLNLMGVPLGDAGAVALAENESFANLTRLNLSACRIGPRGVDALLNSPHLQRLIELNLYANQGGEALAALADPGVLPNLGLADVAANGVSDELRRRLDHRPAIRAR